MYKQGPADIRLTARNHLADAMRHVVARGLLVPARTTLPFHFLMTVDLRETTLQDLVELTRSADPRRRSQAEAELYERTRRFVCMLIRRRRARDAGAGASTDWLANAVEKSFLSYVRQKEWDGGIPEDPAILKTLATITGRVMMREMDRVSGRQPPATRELDELLGHADPRALSPHAQTEFRDFVEGMNGRLTEIHPDAARVLELAMEGHTFVEIRGQLNLGRGKMHHLLTAMRRLIVLTLAEGEDSRAAGAYRMHEQGIPLPEIARELEVTEEWIEKLIQAIKRRLGT